MKTLFLRLGARRGIADSKYIGAKKGLGRPELLNLSSVLVRAFTARVYFLPLRSSISEE